MDNVTHSLVGVALARAGFQKRLPRATLLMLLSANIPDIDIVSLSRGPVAYVENHRGYTHTFLALPFLALLCVGLTALIGRKRLPLVAAWWAACVGVASHLLLDWTNSYGVRPFLPFSSRWFYLDLNALYDGVILTALFLMLVWPWFVNLISGEIGSKEKQTGRGSAIAALVFLLLFDGLRWTMHQRAVNELNARLYEGEVAAQVAALPEAGNPFRWTGVVETSAAFRLIRLSGFDYGGGSDAEVFFKPEQGIAYRASMKTEPFRYMAYFARFPVWAIEPVLIGSKFGQSADLTDLRFGTPGAGAFHAVALINAAGQVVESRFVFSLKNLHLAD